MLLSLGNSPLLLSDSYAGVSDKGAKLKTGAGSFGGAFSSMSLPPLLNSSVLKQSASSSSSSSVLPLMKLFIRSSSA